MFAAEAPIRREEQDGAIKRSAIALHDTDDQVHSMVARQAAERIAARARDFHGAFVVDPKLFAAGRSARAHARPEVQSLRIATYKRLRKDDQPGASPYGIQRQICGLPERAFPVEQDRSGLHHGDGYAILSQAASSQSSPRSSSLARFDRESAHRPPASW